MISMPEMSKLQWAKATSSVQIVSCLAIVAVAIFATIVLISGFEKEMARSKELSDTIYRYRMEHPDRWINGCGGHVALEKFDSYFSSLLSKQSKVLWKSVGAIFASFGSTSLAIMALYGAGRGVCKLSKVIEQDRMQRRTSPQSYLSLKD